MHRDCRTQGHRLVWRMGCYLLVAWLAIGTGAAAAYGPGGRRIGAGLIAGDPTGLTAKGYLSSRTAIQLIGSWSFIDEAVTLIGDVTYDIMNVPVQASHLTLPFYCGVGGKLTFDKGGRHQDRTTAGIRVPVGIALQWTNIPIELAFEIAPGVGLTPETEFDLTGGIAVRYYF